MRKPFKYSMLGIAVLAFSSFALAQDVQPTNQNRNAGTVRNSSGKATDDSGGQRLFTISVGCGEGREKRYWPTEFLP